MSKMLQSWLDNEPTPANWGNIIDVIDGPLQNKSLAIEILQFLGIESGQLFYLIVYKFQFYSIVPKKPISFSSSNESSSQQHDQHGAAINEARQQG